MSTIELKEMSSLSINKIVETLSNAYSKLIKNNQPLTLFPSVMLWGQPGVGKSQAVRQIGESIEKQTGKIVKITDVRLLLFNPIDLRGIPVANEDRTLAVWLKPKIFQMDSSDDVVNILFLDEISAAPQSVQAAAYQITLDRTVGEHKLPDNCIVLAAGNRVTDKSVAYKMPKALANRLLHFDVDSDFNNWKKWAILHDIHPSIVGFLSFKNDCLNTFNPSNDSLAFATPRSWEMVSNILNFVNDDVDKVFSLIAGLVGSGPAIEFRTYVKVYNNLPEVEDIFKGNKCLVPKEQSAIYAISSSIISYARKHSDINGIANAIKYVCNFPVDYSVMVMEDFKTIDKDFNLKLMKMPEFLSWVTKNISLFNGRLNGYFKR